MKFARNDAQQMRRSMLGPAWQWYLVQQALATDEPPPPCLDSVGREVLTYLRLQPKQREKPAGHRHYDIAAASQLWQVPHLREQLQLMVLARCSTDEIAERVLIPAAAVEIAEALYFDVRPLLDASSWVNLHVIQPEVNREAFDFAARLRIAYFGGPAMAKAMTEIGGDLPLTEAERLYDREMLLHAKLQACLAAPLATPQERLRFVGMYLDHAHETQKLELDKERFRAECEERRRAHELALLQQGGTVKVAPGAELESASADSRPSSQHGSTPAGGDPVTETARVA